MASSTKSSRLTTLWASSHCIEGTGNRFLLFDDVNTIFPVDDSAFICAYCDEHPYKPDGLLLLRAQEGVDRSLSIFNRDGSSATFCGNGLRCVVYYLKQPTAHIQTPAGLCQGWLLDDDQVKVSLPPVRVLQASQTVCGRTGIFLHTGTEHFVLETDNVQREDVEQVGKRIRAALDCNVNFYSRQGDQVVVRTFEKGVEKETASCGSGCAAVAYSVIQKTLQEYCCITVSTNDTLLYTAQHGQLFLQGPSYCVVGHE